MDEQSGTLGTAVGFAEHFAAPLSVTVRVVLGAFSKSVPAEVWSTAVDDVVEHVKKLFDTPFPELLAGAWEKSAEIQEFCDPARHPRDESNVLDLASHTLTWTQEPEVEVVFNGTYSVVLKLRVQAQVTVHGGVLVISDARFRKLKTGKVEVKATLSVQGQEVASRKVSVEMPGEVSFGGGIPIRPLISVGRIAAAVEPVSA